MSIRSTATLGVLAGWLGFMSAAVADPLHARPAGDYWHHDSGWIFPARLGSFERVGVPQDVAGTRDAVAYYAREVDGTRIVASVEVLAAESSPEVAAIEGTPSDLPLHVDGVTATQVTSAPDAEAIIRTLYVAVSGEWRVRILVKLPASALPIAGLEDFVRSQRWDTLPR